MNTGAVISWSSPRPVQRARPPAAGRGEPSQSSRPVAAVPAPASPPRRRGGIHRMSTAQMWDAGIVTLMLGVMLLAVIALYVAAGYPLGLGVS